ncbi:MAG: sensor histidine kinase [Niastella sp.]|nr:sensor histidine kinase [Niastella sp.]
MAKQSSLLMHVVFWVGTYSWYLSQYYLFGLDERSMLESSLPERMLITCFHLLPMIAFSYFLCYRVLPLFADRKRAWHGVGELLMFLYCIAVLSRLSKVYVMEPLLRHVFPVQETVGQILTQLKVLVNYYVLGIVSGSFPFLIFHLFSERLRMVRIKAAVEKEKKTAELMALKKQLQPHFLFNTLNNIYSLSLLQSPLAPVAIARLSDILDYLLYRCNDQFVPLQNEIGLLDNYLALQLLRFGDRVVVKTNYVVDGQHQIAPLLLLTVAENMFKHSVEKTSEPVELQLSLQATEKGLLLISRNAFEEIDEKGNGIGLKSLQQQLTLLYPDRHVLTISRAGGIFELQLQILPI